MSRTSRLRPLVGLLVVLGLLLSLGQVTATAAAPASERTAPTAERAAWTANRAVLLSARTPTVQSGDRIRLQGKARAQRRMKVQIQVRPPGVRRWRAAGVVRVGKKQRISYRTVAGAPGRYRYRACLPGRPAKRCSTAVQVRVIATKAVPRVTVDRQVGGTYTGGDQVTVTGSADVAAGHPVRLEAKEAAGWVQVGSATVAAGRFSITGTLSVPGRAVPLRVLVPEGPSHRTTSVPAGSVEVYGWYHLADGDPVAEAAGDWCAVESSTVGGIVERRSIAFGIHCKDQNQAEVDLRGRCRTFTARIGLSDDPYDTTANVRYRVTLLTDGVQRFHRAEIAPGEAFDVSFSTAGARRLRLEVPFVRGTHGLVILGGARLSCAF